MKEVITQATGKPWRRLIVVAVAVVAYAGTTAVFYRGLAQAGDGLPGTVRVVTGATLPNRNVAVRGGQIYVDGEAYLVKGVGWDPTRPGVLPWERSFSAAEVELDFRRIRAAGFNTVRTWAPMSAEELALAARHELKVLQGIWVPPDADFNDPQLRRRVLAEVSRAVETSRWSPAVLGYLVMNEPRAKAVAEAGLEQTTAFLREVVATVRALDPSALIGYASWPGMEALDDPLLDFVAFNLYPHRPRVVMDEFGLPGYLRLLAQAVAKGRPVLVTEYGISVSPGLAKALPGRGGASQAEQAQGLIDLASAFQASGVIGTVAFQWSDGWWKNNDAQGDERTHDPDDPEEWFGLVEFSGADDRSGTPRRALEALTRYNRAIVVEPRAGQVSGERVDVRIFSEEKVSVTASIDGGPAQPVVLRRAGARWMGGALSLPQGYTRHDLELTLIDEKGEILRRERRLLRTAAPRSYALALRPHPLRVAPGNSFTVALESSDPAAVGNAVSIAAFTEDRYNEQRINVQIDARGQASVTLRAPDEPTLLTLLAFENDPMIPPTERASGIAVVEVVPR
jgi:exo-beta-1,3-glucanase (GH17 family)